MADTWDPSNYGVGRDIGPIASTSNNAACSTTPQSYGPPDRPNAFPQGNGTDRDHNPDAFICFLAGAGVKRGHSHGTCDNFGFKAEKDPVYVYEFKATALLQLPPKGQQTVRDFVLYFNKSRGQNSPFPIVSFGTPNLSPLPPKHLPLRSSSFPPRPSVGLATCAHFGATSSCKSGVAIRSNTPDAKTR